MAIGRRRPAPTSRQEQEERLKIRNRLISVAGLFVFIAIQFLFLLNYSGFHNWQTIDTNLVIFVAVNVNIVVLTTVFYLILRNLFKLVYERKKPTGGVGLKTKLIVAFVALSLPSTAFHLMASGFMAFLFQSWSTGEHMRALKSTRVVVESLTVREDQLLRRMAEDIVAYLPRDRKAYNKPNWMLTFRPRHQGGIFIYDQHNAVIARWVSDAQVLANWQPPAPESFKAGAGASWNQRTEKQTLKRLLLPIPNTHPPLKVEVLEVTPPDLSEALDALTRQQDSKVFLGQDLLLLVLTILIVMTLFIIFAATWMAFYLARGFVTPIEKLAEATERVSQGDLGYQVGGGSLGPLERDFKGLVQSFNLMSRQLKDQRLALVQSAGQLRNSHQELSERNRLVELLLENVDAGIVSLNRQGQVNTLNRAALRLVQPRLEPWQSRHYRHVFPKELVRLLDEIPERALGDGGRPFSQIVTLQLSNRPAHVEVSVHPLENPAGASEGLVLLLKDVTALQRTQRALAWREVARRVAHEIKNPLQPIQTSAERIRRKYLTGSNGEGDILDQCTRTIIDTVAGLKQMVNAFSEFAKLPESKPVPDELNAVVRDVAHFYENGLPEAIRLELDLDPAVPRFPLDREQIKRALTNLIDNAASSIQGPGVIGIRTRYDEEAHLVCAEVSDTGGGVPEAVQKRLFEPYTSTKEGGTGLGLTIVNQIVSDHNGYVRYSAREPHGSSFTLEFSLR
jgi:two-component system nitrogen regulation sensor histidine kinase NtrY